MQCPKHGIEMHPLSAVIRNPVCWKCEEEAAMEEDEWMRKVWASLPPESRMEVLFEAFKRVNNNELYAALKVVDDRAGSNEG